MKNIKKWLIFLIFSSFISLLNYFWLSSKVDRLNCGSETFFGNSCAGPGLALFLLILFFVIPGTLIIFFIEKAEGYINKTNPKNKNYKKSVLKLIILAIFIITVTRIINLKDVQIFINYLAPNKITKPASEKVIRDMKKQEHLSETSIEVLKNETMTWKTYTNTKYGFEFKYSSDFVLTKKSTSKNIQLNFNSDTKNEALSFTVYATKDKKWSLTERKKMNERTQGEEITTEITSFNDVPALNTKYHGSPQSPIIDEAYFIRNGITYTLSFITANSPERLKEKDKILSTFKFIN